MSTLVWNVSECPSCGATVVVGILSLSATCACGMYYVDLIGRCGWYFSRAAYERGSLPILEPGGHQ